MRHGLEKVLCQILFLFWIFSYSLTCPHTFLFLCLFKSACSSKSLSSPVGPSVHHKSGSMSSLFDLVYTYRLIHLLFSPCVYFPYSHSVSRYVTPPHPYSALYVCLKSVMQNLCAAYPKTTYAKSKWIMCVSASLKMD